MAAQDAAQPHPGHSADEAEPGIPGGPQAGGDGKGQRVQRDDDAKIEPQQPQRNGGGLRCQAEQAENGAGEQQRAARRDQQAEVRQPHQPFGVVAGIPGAAGPQALPYDGHRRQVDGRGGDQNDALQRVHDGIGGDGGGGKGGNQAGHQQLADIERRAFQTAGNADAQDTAEHLPLGAQVAEGAQPHPAVGAQQPDHHDGGAQHPGGQGSQPRAQHLQPEAVDQHGVADKIEDISGGGGGHGKAGIALRAEYRRADIVKRQKGIAEDRDGEIGAGADHYRRFDLPEQQPQQGIPKQQKRHRNSQRKAKQQQRELSHRAAGVLLLAAADVLRQHHAAAGRQRREQPQKDRVDRIDERDAGDGGLAAGGDHDGIRHADGHGQRLLNHQRHQHPAQVRAGKHSFQAISLLAFSDRDHGNHGF